MVAHHPNHRKFDPIALCFQTVKRGGREGRGDSYFPPRASRSPRLNSGHAQRPSGVVGFSQEANQRFLTTDCTDGPSATSALSAFQKSAPCKSLPDLNPLHCRRLWKTSKRSDAEVAEVAERYDRERRFAPAAVLRYPRIRVVAQVAC
jgi:hypothetical protein